MPERRGARSGWKARHDLGDRSRLPALRPLGADLPAVPRVVPEEVVSDQAAKAIPDEKLLEWATTIGADVSATLMRDLQQSSPQLAALMHSAALVWAARVADENLSRLFAENGTEEERVWFRGFLEKVRAHADAKVTETHRLSAIEELLKPHG